MSKDYEVGYAKPPRQHQFKPGNQAARRGRKPKASISIPEILSEVLKRRRKIRRGDDLVDMSVAQILAERLVQMATGSPRELRMFMDLIEKYAPQHLTGPQEKLEIVYHRAEGSSVELPSSSLWKGDQR